MFFKGYCFKILIFCFVVDGVVIIMDVFIELLFLIVVRNFEVVFILFFLFIYFVIVDFR